MIRDMFGVTLIEGFAIGPIFIRLYGLLIAVGMGLAYWLAIKVGKKLKISRDQVENAFVLIVGLGIVGARIYHVVDYWSYYWQFPSEIIMIWNGGLGIYGAILGGLVGMVIVSWRNKIKLLDWMNVSVLGLILAQALGRIGNWANVEGFGLPTDLPWKLYVSPTLRPVGLEMYEYYHPTFIYESLLCLVGFGVLAYLYRKGKVNYLAGSYLVIYGLIRLITERFRLDTAMVGRLAVADVFSIVSVLVGVWLIYRQFKLESVKIA